MSENWREAKMPKWARDAIEAELDQWRLTAALAWPTEAKPEPLPFMWGDYDRIIGDPLEGTYYAVPNSESLVQFDLAKSNHWKGWVFKPRGYDWSIMVVRGPLFARESDAKLYRRWLICEECARKLLRALN